MQVVDDQKANIVKWLCYVAIVAGLAMAAVILGPVIRYSYDMNDTFGLEIRTDRFTGEKCFDADPDEMAPDIGLQPC